MLKLLYTLGSPFARKIRIALAEKGVEYESDIERGSNRATPEFSALNPNRTIPVMIDGDVTLFESNVILEYVLQKYPKNAPDSPKPPLAATLTRPAQHWEDVKTLTILDAVGDIIVNMRSFKSSGVDVENVDYGKRQQARFNSCIDWLEKRATREGFVPGTFSFQDINLICPLGYLDERATNLKGILEWRGRPKLEAIVDRWAERPSVSSTAPGPG